MNVEYYLMYEFDVNSDKIYDYIIIIIYEF